jgi:SAM-dependent methyltransferase
MLSNLFRMFFPDKTGTDFPGGYIPNKFIVDQINSGHVLVIGDYTGRDFLPLKKKYPDTKLLDIVDNNIADTCDLTLQSICDKTSFLQESFQYIVMAEVIEHLWEDMVALQEIHRLLVPGGGLVMTVPFYHDKPEHHFRIHSPKTIQRLLEHAGFQIVKLSYRGVANGMPYWLVACAALLLYPFYRRTSLEKVNHWVYSLHNALSRFKRLNRLSGRYGALILARKELLKIDSMGIQKKAFSTITVK